MNHWLYPANIKLYDVLGAFAASKVVWPIRSKVELGDVIFIYLAAPYQQVAYLCKVVEVNLDDQAVAELVQPFLKDQNYQKPPTTLFMMLQVDQAFPLQDSSPLSFFALKQNGFKGMLMGPRKLENCLSLLDYLRSHAG